MSGLIAFGRKLPGGIMFSSSGSPSCALKVCSLLMAGRLMKILGETGANVMDRLFGVILAALAVQFVLDGIRAVFMPA